MTDDLDRAPPPGPDLTLAPPGWRRLADARVRHLEIWDAVAGGASLFAQRGSEAYPARVAEVVVREAEAAGAGVVYLAGGDPRLPSVDQAIRRAGLRTVVASEPCFVAALGAAATVASFRAPLVVDAGQTSFKVVGPRGRERVPRVESWQGESGFLGAFRGVLANAGPHDAAVVGLPCRIVGEVGLDSSYFERLDLAALAALFDVPLWIASDAELAAHAAIAELPGEGALAVTLGHGVGAAMVRP